LPAELTVLRSRFHSLLNEITGIADVEWQSE
jgi:hypothetical protein